MRRYGSVEPSTERIFPGQEQVEETCDETLVREPEKNGEQIEAIDTVALPHHHEAGKCGEPSEGDDELRSSALF